VRKNSEALAWAQQELGHAALGHVVRTTRAVRMLARMGERPAAKLTEIFENPAEREAAYRFVENDKVDAAALVDATAQATMQRAGELGLSLLFVPVDQCTVSLNAARSNESFGPVGKRDTVTRGFHSMNAVGVDAEGTVLGPLGQVYWVRSNDSEHKTRKNRNTRAQRPFAEKETRHWITTQELALEAKRRSNAKTRLWFQLDRGGDFAEELLWAPMSGEYVTCRVAQNRKILSPEEGYIFDVLARQEELGTFQLSISGSQKRTAREATISIKSASVVIRTRDAWTSRSEVPVELFAVYAVEVSEVPEGEDRVEWMLLTTYPVQSFEDARLTVFGYAQRWRIEECHKAWKSADCKVEESELRDPQHVIILAILLFSVAARIERLKRLARAKPNVPATLGFTTWELVVLIAKFAPHRVSELASLTIGEAVLWTARMGGYTGKSSGGPPGTITLARGLNRLHAQAEAAELIANLPART
jgi:hypothetical protein